MRKIYLLFLLFSLLFGIIEAQVTLPVHRIKQIKSKWCWAACAQMIDSFYRGNQSYGQCALAYNYYKSINKINQNVVPDCVCNACSLGNCSANFPLDFSTHYLDGNYHKVLLKMGYYSNFDTLITWKTVKAQIDQCRPFLIFISLRNGGRGGHMVLVKGYEETASNKYLIINDPWRWAQDCGQCSELQKIEFNATGNPICVMRIDAFILNIQDKANMLSGDCTNVFASSFINRSTLNNNIESIRVEQPIEIETLYVSDSILLRDNPKSVEKASLPIKAKDVYYPSSGTKELQQLINGKYVVFGESKCEEKSEIILKRRHEEFLLSNSKNDAKYKKYKKVIFPYPNHFEFYYFKELEKEYLAPVTDYEELKFKSYRYYGAEEVLSQVRKFLVKDYSSIK